MAVESFIPDGHPHTWMQLAFWASVPYLQYAIIILLVHLIFQEINKWQLQQTSNRCCPKNRNRTSCKKLLSISGTYCMEKSYPCILFWFGKLIQEERVRNTSCLPPITRTCHKQPLRPKLNTASILHCLKRQFELKVFIMNYTKRTRL